jgi:hypothetical protein
LSLCTSAASRSSKRIFLAGVERFSMSLGPEKEKMK